MLRWLWSSLLRIIARNRAVTLALLSAVASVFMGLAVVARDNAVDTQTAFPMWQLVAFALAVFLIVCAGAVPADYEAAERLDFILPVIHQVLGLAPEDRVTVHRLRAFPARGYEQLTEYYPRQARRTRGRTFGINHGIVAQVLNHPGAPYAWAIPDGETFDTAMMTRWSFNEQEVRSLTPDRRSFLAYPIGQDRKWARAVLYMDSPDGSRFHGAAGDAAIERLRETFDAQLVHAFQG